MTFLYALLLGAIQGITEFMPVSSSAHLLVIPKLFGLPYQGKEFDVFLNLGSLLAILVFFRSAFFNMLFGFKDFMINRKSQNRYFFVTLFWSSLPTIVIFGIAEIFFSIEINSAVVMGISMIVFAVVLYLCDTRQSAELKVTRTDSILTGIAQTMSLIPGVSRLGACLSMMRYLNYTREDSFKYSMILSIPPVMGACSLKLLKIISSGTQSIEWEMVGLGCFASFVFGLVSLEMMCRFLRKFTLFPIVIYRILFGLLLLFGTL